MPIGHRDISHTRPDLDTRIQKRKVRQVRGQVGKGTKWQKKSNGQANEVPTSLAGHAVTVYASMNANWGDMVRNTYHGDVCGHENQNGERKIPTNDDSEIVEDRLFSDGSVLVEDHDDADKYSHELENEGEYRKTQGFIVLPNDLGRIGWGVASHTHFRPVMRSVCLKSTRRGPHTIVWGRFVAKRGTNLQAEGVGGSGMRSSLKSSSRPLRSCCGSEREEACCTICIFPPK